MHLAIWVFLLSLATSCVEWIGKTVLVELVSLSGIQVGDGGHG
jgi:hypothetical protein